MKYKAILFDMDGVLILSEALTAKASACALQELGIPCRESDFIQFAGAGEVGYMGGVAGLYGKPYSPKMTEKAYAYYNQLISDQQKPEGLDAVLAYLKSCGYKMAVCSSANADKVSANLRAIGHGTEFFDVVLTGSDISCNKPDPEIFLTAADRLGEKPEECVVIEDSVNGIRAAHSGNMDAIAICTTFDRDTLLKEKPTEILDTIQELQNIL